VLGALVVMTGIGLVLTGRRPAPAPR